MRHKPSPSNGPSEKLEIIRLVERSALVLRPILKKFGVSRATFYRWYDQYQRGGPRPAKPLVSSALRNAAK